ncbi:ABC transporter ATP-binding protein [Limosilactobacillus secaliphilus]|uniref:ABC transporter ATP-binding component n=1 Tax=Limosilactobacillus secaliphilus TaxID=396268 RepID=A0A0R2HZX9_9LACO|nr:ABC transporter ATP-binding protein [Limosilactobacillus secaliphilus]KRN58431.1 ABC transporter ATP-binding component [Limosilactobacillus secaliphilus]
MNAIEIHQLTFAYQKKQPVLSIDQLTIQLHRFTILHGPSGSGKSTLLKIIANFLPRHGGQLSGQLRMPKSQRVAMMFQDPGMQFALDTPRHEIEFALENLQVTSTDIAPRVDAALTQVGISDLADRRFATLSGGEQQRAALAVIIAMDADILLLDEPFASLDSHNRQLLIASLVQLQQAGKTIIIADHDLSGYRGLNADIVSFKDKVVRLSHDQAQFLLDQAPAQSIVTDLLDTHESPAVSLHHFRLKRADQLLIDQPELEFMRNRVTLITGESGSGKSSLLLSLAGLLDYEGSVTLFKWPLNSFKPRELGRKVGLTFQRASDQFLNVTVAEELALSRRQGKQTYFNNDRLNKWLKRLGLSKMDDRVVYSLSGGQQKKLQVLLMLMMGQPLLLMDEPFSGLDAQSAADIAALIRACQEHSGITVIMVSHQFTNLSSLVDYQLALANHQLTYQGRKQS